MVCSDMRNSKLFGDRVGGIDHERGNLRMDNIQTQLPEKLMKNVLGSPWFRDPIRREDPGVNGWNPGYVGFTIWIELRILRGEDVNVVPLFSKILEQVGYIDHVPVINGPVVFSNNANIHDLALMEKKRCTGILQQPFPNF